MNSFGTHLAVDLFQGIVNGFFHCDELYIGLVCVIEACPKYTCMRTQSKHALAYHVRESAARGSPD